MSDLKNVGANPQSNALTELVKTASKVSAWIVMAAYAVTVMAGVTTGDWAQFKRVNSKLVETALVLLDSVQLLAKSSGEGKHGKTVRKLKGET